MVDNNNNQSSSDKKNNSDKYYDTIIALVQNFYCPLWGAFEF